MFDLFVQQCALEHQPGCVIAGLKFVCYFSGAFHSCPLCGRRVQKGAHACHLRHLQSCEQLFARLGIHSADDYAPAVAAYLHTQRICDIQGNTVDVMYIVPVIILKYTYKLTHT